VDVLSLLFRRLRNRAPGGEHLDEAGDRGESRVVVRPEGSTSARARGSGDDDLAGRYDVPLLPPRIDVRAPIRL
jgi:hypothetical protein